MYDTCIALSFLSVLNDPTLFIFVAGALAGVAATLLVSRVLDVLFIIQHILAKRGHPSHRARRIFPM